MSRTTTSKGFTLLETLAAIAILSLVVMGPLSVLSSSSAYARQTKDVVTATYLAEEGVELLQNQYDSLYIYCKKNPTATDPSQLCEPSLDENTGMTTWRIFKERFGSMGGQKSCYFDEDREGCSFDASSFLIDISSSDPVRRSASSTTDTACLYLTEVVTKVTIAPSLIEKSLTMYKCNGSNPSVYGGAFSSSKMFKRSVIVEQLATFEGGGKYVQYNDDLRVTVHVSFTGVNGVAQNIKVVRFMHARL